MVYSEKISKKMFERKMMTEHIHLNKLFWTFYITFFLKLKIKTFVVIFGAQLKFTVNRE